MKRLIIFGVAFLVTIAFGGRLDRAIAGDTGEVKEGSKGAVTLIKEDVAKTGKAIAETGKEIKKGSKKGWSDFKKDAVKTGAAVKEGAREVGQKIKKAFQGTGSDDAKEVSGNNPNQSDEGEPEEKK